MHRRSPPGRANVRRWAARRNCGPFAQQNFAAPYGPIGAIAGAVPGEPQHGPAQPVLRHARRHMGVMVLHAHQRHVPAGGQPLGVLRRGVVGVQVAGHRLGRRLKNPTRSSIARRNTSTLRTLPGRPRGHSSRPERRMGFSSRGGSLLGSSSSGRSSLRSPHPTSAAARKRATVFFRWPPNARIVGTPRAHVTQVDRQRNESPPPAKHLHAVGN